VAAGEAGATLGISYTEIKVRIYRAICFGGVALVVTQTVAPLELVFQHLWTPSMPCQDVSPIVASHHGAIAIYEFWAFDRSNWTNGKPAGFQLSWSNGSTQAQAAAQGISTLQSMAIEIGDRHKLSIPCCCLPPAFTPGSVENTATEMNSGGFVAAAANATGLSTMVIAEWVSDNNSSNPYVFLILLPLAAQSAMQAAHPPPPPPVAPSAPRIAPDPE